MALLPDARIEELKDVLLAAPTFQYSPELRRLFFSAVNRKFFLHLTAIPGNEEIQLWNDLVDLNNAEKLADGTVPLESWLDKAGRFLKPFADATKVIQHALADLAKQQMNVAPIVNAVAPSQPIVDNIVKERIVGRNDMVSYAFLEAGMLAGNAVVRMKVKRFDNGVLRLVNNEPSIYLGTGWLLTKDLVITNHHVINARNDNEPDAGNSDFKSQAEQAVSEFDYNTDNVAGLITGVSKCEAADKNLDYAILRLAQPVERIPLVLLPDHIVADAANPQVVNIIQHPLGNSKKVALRNNHIFDSNFPKVRYFTDTDAGSSGSAVFDDKWQVIALHRASTLVDNVQYQNQKTAWVNEGVQIAAVLEHLAANLPALAAEINA